MGNHVEVAEKPPASPTGANAGQAHVRLSQDDVSTA